MHVIGSGLVSGYLSNLVHVTIHRKLYLLIPLTWDYCYIMSVSLTVPGRINYGNFKIYWVLQPLFYVEMATIIQ